ncbi:MAG: Crp/Fnr family transcriptional regulator [Janthinobacterium lividum]
MSSSATFANEILAALPPAELSALRPHLLRVRMVNGQGLHEPGERIEHVYFFESGLASMVAVAQDEGIGVEVGVIGPEGMVGLTTLLDPEATAFNRAMVQMPGIAYRMPAATLRTCLDEAPILRRRLLRRLDSFVALVSQTAACNSRHSINERCARWLLLAHDRNDGDELPLTQEFLATMLAVRRSGVTVALGALREAGLVHNGRGRIMICDRPGLEASACECYGRVRSFISAITERDAADAANA